MMPQQKPGRSRQDYSTPFSLIQAIQGRFHENIEWDLAAVKSNAVCPKYLGPDHSCSDMRDSFKVDWAKLTGLLFLNPPFLKIDPWAERCYEMSLAGRRILFLTPASVGARWFHRHVWGKAYVMYLTPRLTFGNETTPYPKDCCISYFCHGIAGSEIFDWKALLDADKNGLRSPLAASQTHRKPKTASRQPKAPQTTL